MRKIIIALLALAILPLAGCGSEAPTAPAEEKLYTIGMDTAAVGNLKITYPVVSGLEDPALETAINTELKTKAMQAADIFGGETAGISGDVTTEGKLETPAFYSAVFSGVVNVEHAAHPANAYFTAMIDINDGKSIILTELVAVDPDLISKLRAGRYLPYSEDLDLDAADELSNVLGMLSDEEIMAQLNDPNANFYLDNGNLVISLSVPHVVGDHLEMAIPFNELGDNATDHPLWAEVTSQ